MAASGVKVNAEVLLIAPVAHTGADGPPKGEVVRIKGAVLPGMLCKTKVYVCPRSRTMRPPSTETFFTGASSW